MRSEIKVAKAATSHCREKLLARDGAPVPQTDTGKSRRVASGERENSR